MLPFKSEYTEIFINELIDKIIDQNIKTGSGKYVKLKITCFSVPSFKSPGACCITGAQLEGSNIIHMTI